MSRSTPSKLSDKLNVIQQWPWVLYNNDIDELYSNFFPSAVSVNLKGEALAEKQSLVVVSGLQEASVMRCVTWAPALFYLERDDKLTGIEAVVWSWIVLAYFPSSSQTNTRRSLNSKTGSQVMSLSFFIYRLKANKTDPVRHTKFWIAVLVVSNFFIKRNQNFDSDQTRIFQNISGNYGYFKESGVIQWTCVECKLFSGTRTKCVDVRRMGFEPGGCHVLVVDDPVFLKDNNVATDWNLCNRNRNFLGEK